MAIVICQAMRLLWLYWRTNTELLAQEDGDQLQRKQYPKSPLDNKPSNHGPNASKIV